MTAPFAPELTSPANKAGTTTSVTLKWKFRSVAAGDYMATYAIRRRAMTPTVGAYEYWNGTIWTTETFLTGPASPNQVFDGMTASITISTGWTAGVVYQWSVKCRNAAAEASTYADDLIIQPHAAPTMTTAISSTAVSRPTISWVWAGASGLYMKNYRVAIWQNFWTVVPGFDPALPSFQAYAAYLGPTTYSSTDYKVTIDRDLVAGFPYWIYYITEDSSGLSSGWVKGPFITPSFTSVPAPSLTVTTNEASGTSNIVVRSAFNLLSDDQSIFTDGIGSWVASLNCEQSWNSSTGKLTLTGSGMSYAALDVAQTTYAAMDTAYATYATQTSTQVATVGTSRAVSGDATSEMIAVAPTVQYSAVATVNTNVARTVKIGLRWFTSGGAASATPVTQGTGVTTVANTDTQVYVLAAAAPADAAFAAVEIEWTTSAVGDVVLVDNVAMASSTTITWSPSGNSFDVSFVVERSTDNITWVPVWGCSSSLPKASDSGAVSQITVTDRALPMGVATVYYRAYAVSKFSSSPVWSSVASTSVAGIKPERWYLRRTETVGADSQIIIGSISETQALQREMFEPEGRTNPIVSYSAAPKTRVLDVELMTTDRVMHEAIMAALRSEETLYLQTNRDGDGYYIRPVDTVKRNQKRAVAVESYNSVRNLFDVTFTAIVVDDFY